MNQSLVRYESNMSNSSNPSYKYHDMPMNTPYYRPTDNSMVSSNYANNQRNI